MVALTLATLGTTIAPWLSEWATVAIAETILKNTSSLLNKNDVEKALKVAVTNADEQYQQVFFKCDPKVRRKFLDDYFQGKVLEELQKPLKDQAIDLGFLLFVFQEAVKSSQDEKNPINQEFIKLWLKVFKAEYLKAIGNLKFHYAKANYLKQLANWYDDVKFVGINVSGQESDKSEKLVKIFVMQDVKEEKKERYVNLGEADLLELADQENRQGELSRQQRQRFNSENHAGNAFSAKDLLTKNQAKKMILLGVPGSGKTTLMSYFSVIIAQDKAESLGLNPEVDWLPILIRMRDYVRQDDLNILEYYRFFCQKSLSVSSLPEGFFEHWLQDGRALILLDGLDEVVEEGKRHEIVQKIENFLGSYDQNRVIITSRPAGYRRDFFRAEEFPHYVLQPFDEAKINRFIENWYDSRSQDQEDAKRRKEDIRKAFANNPHIHHLARNPLLLTIITLIHRYQAQLPRERYKLYQSAVETLLTTWDTTNKQLEDHHKLEYLKNDDWEDLIQNLAFWIHYHHDGIEGNDSEGTLIDKDELIKFLATYIKETKKIDFSKAKKEAQRFVDFVRDRSGLLNEQGTDCYAFVHKTFQEYLCAQKIQRDMEENSYDFEIILDAIRTHLHDSHWREVLLLLVAQQKGKSAAKAIRVILENKSEYEQWLHRDLLFAGSCLAENPKGLNSADSKLVSEILKRLVELEISDNHGDKLSQKLYDVFCGLYETDCTPKCLALLRDNNTQLDPDRLLKYRVALGEREAVINELIEQLSENDNSACRNAVEALGNLDNVSDMIIKNLLSMLGDRNNLVRGEAARALGNLGNASTSVIEALLKSLDDSYSDNWVRRSAIEALGNLGDTSENVVEALLKGLEDEDDVIRWHATEALINCNLEGVIDRVIEESLGVLSNGDNLSRQNKAEILGWLGKSSNDVIRALLNTLSDQEYLVRVKAVEALGNLGNGSDNIEHIIESLLKVLVYEKENYVRREIVEVLGSLGKISANSDTIVKDLFRTLSRKYENDWVRGNAVEALGSLGKTKVSDEVVVQLHWFLSDHNDRVRRKTAEALSKLLDTSNEVIIRALLVDLSSNNILICEKVASALTNISKQSPNVKTLVVEWIQQHENSNFVGNGIDVLWDLVTG